MIYAKPGTAGALVTLKPRYGNYIGGEFVAPLSGQYFSNTSPVDGSVIGEFPRSNAADIDKALDAAHAAADAWGRTSVQERSHILLKIADRIEANLELLSGGDCLMVDDDNLEYIIKRLRAIPHVEIVRLGSRTPVVCPQRITPELCAMLKKYHPIWLNTHFNTPKEFSPEAAKACAMLADAGIPLGNQSVLLAGVNDCIHVMMDLVHGLVQMRVRPYYIYACDPSLGLSHFRTPVSKGIEIMEALRGHTSGYCIPTFVVDAPGGGGKTPVMPTYLISQTPRKVILRNFEGVITSYTQPEHYVQNCHCDVCMGKKKVEKTGVAWVAEGTKQRYLEPTKLLRNERHVKK